jgi:4a-hydroxytetrahydrobiopterin dehydratase
MEKLLTLHCDEADNRNLSQVEIDAYLQEVIGWQSSGSSIFKTVNFESFAEAIEFVNAVASVAESEGHHPNITVRYDTVTLELSTHDAAAITLFDFILAANIDTLV